LTTDGQLAGHPAAHRFTQDRKEDGWPPVDYG